LGVPHLDAQRVLAFFAKPGMRTPEQQTLVSESDALIEEINQAQVIVIGLPMYNFGIPSTLKAYFRQPDAMYINQLVKINNRILQ
jgi:FMN-dependent NADH-azoreductase